MIFASTDLARRIEAAECGLVEEYAAAVARRKSGGVVFVCGLAGGVAACSGPDSPLTKVVGLGFGGMPGEDELARVEAEFAARGAAVQVELCALAESGIAERLTRRGYALVGLENVLGRELDGRAAWREPREIAIERSGPAELDSWIEIVVEAFAEPDAQGVASHESFGHDEMRQSVRDMAATSGFVRYLARRAGEPAGAASLRTSAGIAQLCGAGTLPAHRRRGVQAALLERRLADAARAAGELAVVTTLPGSKSQANVQRHGFELLYARAILRRGA